MGGLRGALVFDFDAPPPQPDWVVDDIVERGTVTMFSADSGKGKSIVMADLIVAVVQGREWLGRETHGQRVVVIDGENSPRLVRSRLQAFGMTNADRKNVWYFNRTGVNLGEGDWFRQTEETLADFQPDLLIIDTAAAATAAPVNDNDAVSALYKTVLRPFTYYCPVILLHHERKQSGDATKQDRGQVMMGARQWFGQADAHFSLETPEDVEPWESTWTPEGLLERHHLNLVRPKDRDRPMGGVVAAFSVTSLKEDDGVTRKWMRLELASSQTSLPTRNAQEDWFTRVEGIVRDVGGNASLSEIADTLHVGPSEHPSLLRGLKAMVEDGRLTSPSVGAYELASAQKSLEV